MLKRGLVFYRNVHGQNIVYGIFIIKIIPSQLNQIESKKLRESEESEREIYMIDIDRN